MTTRKKLNSGGIIFDTTRFQRPSERTSKTKKGPTWEGVDVVEYWQKHFDVPEKGAFGKTYYYRQIKQLKISLHQAKKIVDIMQSRRTWLKNTKGEDMHCGKWLVNRFKEMREVGVDGFISKNS